MLLSSGISYLIVYTVAEKRIEYKKLYTGGDRNGGDRQCENLYLHCIGIGRKVRNESTSERVVLYEW